MSVQRYVHVPNIMNRPYITLLHAHTNVVPQLCTTSDLFSTAPIYKPIFEDNKIMIYKFVIGLEN